VAVVKESEGDYEAEGDHSEGETEDCQQIAQPIASRLLTLAASLELVECLFDWSMSPGHGAQDSTSDLGVRLS
jgi:hypothetical protein